MDQNIILSLIGIVPAVVAFVVNFGICSQKTKVDGKVN